MEGKSISAKIDKVESSHVIVKAISVSGTLPYRLCDGHFRSEYQISHGLVRCPREHLQPRANFSSGDSYSTTSSFAGGATPSLANPIGNPQFPGQTTSGGLNWVGQAIAKLNSSVVLSHDFAVSGATIDTSIVQTWAGSGVDDQVDLFGQYIADAGTWNPQNTLTAVWVGINDVGHPYWDGIEAPICQAMQRYLQLLNILYGHGLRNFILFTVPRK